MKDKLKKRYLQQSIISLAFQNDKMAFISGPRQCGKTTLATMLAEQHKVSRYYNWDDIEFRKTWLQTPKSIIPSSDTIPLVILDEIHKDRTWKRTLKGVYDTLNFNKKQCNILVTGSARLNVYHRGSDSLLGRYFHFRLAPFSLRELSGHPSFEPDDVLDAIFNRSYNVSPHQQDDLNMLINYGPFPEPLLKQNTDFYKVWRKNRHDLIIREDLRDLSHLNDLTKIEMLAAILPDKVGSPLSISSLKPDMEKAHDTIKLWLNWLKQLYFHFEIKPWSKSIARSLKKESKIYLWDYTEIKDAGPRFENLVAMHLIKTCNYWTDTGKGEFQLYYLRNRDKQEIDFLIVKDHKPWLPVEVKKSDDKPSPNWRKFLPLLPCKRALQITENPTWKLYSEGDTELLVAGANEALMYFV
jgi:predicted AAA+ superfamily ATPase